MRYQPVYFKKFGAYDTAIRITGGFSYIFNNFSLVIMSEIPSCIVLCFRCSRKEKKQFYRSNYLVFLFFITLHFVSIYLGSWESQVEMFMLVNDKRCWANFASSTKVIPSVLVLSHCFCYFSLWVQ